MIARIIYLGTALLLTGCAQTTLGEGASVVTGSVDQPGAGQDNGRRDGKNEQASALPKCEKPLGRVSIVEKDIPALAQMGLTSPAPVIRLMVSQSNCFQIIDQGPAMARIQEERAASGRGKGAKLASVDYYITPDIISQNSNAGSFAGGAGSFLPGMAGTIAGGLSQRTSEAQTALYLTDAKTGVQISAATGTAKSADFGLSLSNLSRHGGGSINIDTGYSNTEIGKTTSAAFLDAYRGLVKQVQAQQGQTQQKVARR